MHATRRDKVFFFALGVTARFNGFAQALGAAQELEVDDDHYARKLNCVRVGG